MIRIFSLGQSLYRFTPDELRFIMIDPKVVEMQMYNSLPHLIVPVVLPNLRETKEVTVHLPDD